MKIIKEEVEVVLTDAEMVEIFDLDPATLLDEAWEGDPEIEQTGQYAGKSTEELCAMKNKLMDKKSRDASEQKKVRQINFAIRSKQKGPKFGKVEC